MSGTKYVPSPGVSGNRVLIGIGIGAIFDDYGFNLLS
jgi:hypothetical protein